MANLYLLGNLKKDALTEREVGESGNEIRENRDTELNYRRCYEV